MIPKIIHYCWFGKKVMSKQTLKYLETWKKYCPNYELIRWDESNYCITKNAYMRQAYDAKKWGFVPDYARLDIIYQYGGIYLDTDVELLRSFDSLLENSAFLGIEAQDRVNLGQGFGAEAGHPLIKEMRDMYDNLRFLNENGTQNLTVSPYYQTQLLKQYGLKGNREQFIRNAHIYPSDFFCPKDLETGRITLTENTYSIHHFDASWMSPSQRTHTRIAQWIGPLWTKRLKQILGRDI